jgi:hypothetical protein
VGRTAPDVGHPRQKNTVVWAGIPCRIPAMIDVRVASEPWYKRAEVMVSLVLGILTAVIMIWQLNTIERTLRETEKSSQQTDEALRISQQTYDQSLQSTHIEHRPWLIVRQLRYDKMRAGNPFVLRGTLANRGHSPATNVMVRVVYRDFDPTASARTVQSGLQAELDKVESTGSFTMQPDGNAPFGNEFDPVSRLKIRQIESGKVVRYIAGVIQYDDGLPAHKDHHHTSFCVETGGELGNPTTKLSKCEGVESMD